MEQLTKKERLARQRLERHMAKNSTPAFNPAADEENTDTEDEGEGGAAVNDSENADEREV